MRWDLHFGFNHIPAYSTSPDFRSILEHDIRLLLAKNKTIFIAGQIPLYHYNVSRLYRTPSKENMLDLSYENANAILQGIDKKYDGVHYIDLSNAVKRWPNGMINSLPGYKDQNHLNAYGQEILVNDSDEFLWASDIIKGK